MVAVKSSAGEYIAQTVGFFVHIRVVYPLGQYGFVHAPNGACQAKGFPIGKMANVYDAAGFFSLGVQYFSAPMMSTYCLNFCGFMAVKWINSDKIAPMLRQDSKAISYTSLGDLSGKARCMSYMVRLKRLGITKRTEPVANRPAATAQE